MYIQNGSLAGNETTLCFGVWHSILAPLLPFLFHEDYRLLKTVQFIHRSVRLNRMVIRGNGNCHAFFFAQLWRKSHYSICYAACHALSRNKWQNCAATVICRVRWLSCPNHPQFSSKYFLYTRCTLLERESPDANGWVVLVFDWYFAETWLSIKPTSFPTWPRFCSEQLARWTTFSAPSKFVSMDINTKFIKFLLL